MYLWSGQAVGLSTGQPCPSLQGSSGGELGDRSEGAVKGKAFHWVCTRELWTRGAEAKTRPPPESRPRLCRLALGPSQRSRGSCVCTHSSRSSVAAFCATLRPACLLCVSPGQQHCRLT